jgi:hypothetical protein
VFQPECNDLQQLFGRIRPAVPTVTAHFQAADNNVEAAVALDLSLEAVEKIAFELHDLATTKTCHVDVIALWTPLVEVLLALHVHQVEFVDKPMPLQ